MNQQSGHPVVSVVLPVFNVASCVDDAIEDLRSQTFADWEALFVDDCSEDDSAAHVEAAAEKDPRIRLVRQPARGFAGVARNRGIDEARGDYLLFLDPDDRFEPELMSSALKSAGENGSDLVVFNADRLDVSTGRVFPLAGFPASDSRLDGCFRPQDVPDALFGSVMFVPWLGLFKRAFVQSEGLRFQESRSANDVFFVAMARASAKRISRVPDILVHYRTGMKASLSTTKSKSPLDTYEAFASTCDEMRRRGLFGAFRDFFVPSAVRSCVFCLESALKEPGPCRTFYDRLKNGGLERLGFGEVPEEAFAKTPNGGAALSRGRSISELSYDEFCVLAIAEAAQLRRRLSERNRELAGVRRQLDRSRADIRVLRKKLAAAPSLVVPKGRPFRRVRSVVLQSAVALLRDGPGGVVASVRANAKARSLRKRFARLDKMVRPLLPVDSFEASVLENERKPETLPLVSTIITTYNHERFVERAIQSALSQTGRFRHRIFLADNGSTDGTRAIVRAYAERYPSTVKDISVDENIGISGNIRRCFALAEGDYLALLEGDDFWLSPRKLDRQVRFLSAHPDHSMAFSRIALFEDTKKKWRVCKGQEGLPATLLSKDVLAAPRENPIVNFSCCLFRTPLVRALPDVLYENRISEISFAFFMERTGPIGFVGETLSAYRVHSNGVWSGANRRDKLLQQIQCREAALAVCDPECAERLREIVGDLRKKLDELPA